MKLRFNIKKKNEGENSYVRKTRDEYLKQNSTLSFFSLPHKTTTFAIFLWLRRRPASLPLLIQLSLFPLLSYRKKRFPLRGLCQLRILSSMTAVVPKRIERRLSVDQSLAAFGRVRGIHTPGKSIGRPFQRRGARRRRRERRQQHTLPCCSRRRIHRCHGALHRQRVYRRFHARVERDARRLIVQLGIRRQPMHFPDVQLKGGLREPLRQCFHFGPRHSKSLPCRGEQLLKRRRGARTATVPAALLGFLGLRQGWQHVLPRPVILPITIRDGEMAP